MTWISFIHRIAGPGYSELGLLRGQVSEYFHRYFVFPQADDPAKWFLNARLLGDTHDIHKKNFVNLFGGPPC